MLKNIAKHSMECGVSSEEEKEGCGGKDIQKKGFKPRLKEWGVMNDESGESMEPMEEVPLIRPGKSETERLVRGWRRVDSRDGNVCS